MSLADKIYILQSNEENVFKNLAFETALLNYLCKNNAQNVAILFLWKNDNTIVIGKHQNPLKECNMEFVREKNIKIARRISGGGAVYHDKGNLNFSFISSNSIYDKEKNFEILFKAFNDLGLEVEFSGRNDLLIGGKKFSGNAYYKTKNANLHHGTILIKSSKDIITKALTPNIQKFATKSVDSVQSRIVNLNEIKPDLKQKEIEEAIVNSFQTVYNVAPVYNIALDKKELANLYKKYISKSWVYKKYLTNAKELNAYYDWGEIEFKILLEENQIVDINIISDALEENLIETLELTLKNSFFKELEKTFNYLKQTATSEEKIILNDIYQLLFKLNATD